MRIKNICWGLFYLALAVIIVLSQLGVLTGFSWWSIAISLLCIPLMVKSIMKREFLGVFIPLAIIARVFAVPLHIQSLSIWILILVGTILSIGFSFIFPKHRNHYEHHVDFDNIENIASDDEKVTIYSNFGASVKYIKSENLKIVNIQSRFSGVKVYLDSASLSDDGVNIIIHSRFSGIELYIPKECRVEYSIDGSMQGTEESGHTNAEKTGPTITISGQSDFSGISVKYV